MNLLPHAVSVLTPAGTEVVIGPSGRVARLSVRRRPAGTVALPDGVSAAHSLLDYGDIEDLPAPTAGVRYLVSLPVALVARRPDLLVVDDVIRGADGQVTACRSFGTIAT